MSYLGVRCFGILAVCIFFVNIAMSQENKIQVQVVDPNFKTEKLSQNPAYSVNAFVPHKKKSIAKRDEIFVSSGVQKHVPKWKHFEKDIFVIRVKSNSVEKLVQLYPYIPKANIIKFKTAIEKE